MGHRAQYLNLAERQATGHAQKAQYANSPQYVILSVLLSFLTHVLRVERSNNARTLGHIRRNTANIQARLPYHQTNSNFLLLFHLCPRPSYCSLQYHCLHPIYFMKHHVAQMFWMNQIFIPGNRNLCMTILSPL